MIDDPDFVKQQKCFYCEEKSKVTLFSIANSYTGVNEVGAASEFSKMDQHGNPTWKIRDGLSIRGSFGYCAEHYREYVSDLVAIGHHQGHHPRA